MVSDGIRCIWKQHSSVYKKIYVTKCSQENECISTHTNLNVSTLIAYILFGTLDTS